jgi:hypothetical protein
VNYTVSSDGRLKTNVVPVKSGLEIVDQLNPVFFDWDQNNPRAVGYGTKHQVGFIAQDLEKVLPEVVDVGADTYRTVEYGKITAVLVAAVKELYHEVIGHNEKIKTLETGKSFTDRDIASLKEDNSRLIQENAEIKSWACSQIPKPVFCK